MSLGSQVIPIRIPGDLLDEIDAAIRSANLHRADAPYDRSTWIRGAVRHKLDHIARSRRPRGRKLAPETVQTGQMPAQESE